MNNTYDHSTLPSYWSLVCKRIIYKFMSIWLRSCLGESEDGVRNKLTALEWSVVTPTDSPYSIRNRYEIEINGGDLFSKLNLSLFYMHMGLWNKTE